MSSPTQTRPRTRSVAKINSKDSCPNTSAPSHKDSSTKPKAQNQKSKCSKSAQNPELLQCPCNDTCSKESNLKWICCDKCSQWWHTFCLGITNQEYEKLKGSLYICPTCAIKKLKNNYCVLSKITNTLQNKIGAKVDLPIDSSAQLEPLPCKTKSEDCTKQTTPVTPGNPEPSTKDSIVILDNLKLNRDQKSSSKLKQEINKVKPDIKLSQVYPLAGGGVALHCKDKASHDCALCDWPISALNPTGNPVPHKIRGLSKEQIIVVKSVNTCFTEQELLVDLKSRYPSVTNVHRLHKKSSDIPFPIIKVSLSREDATAALADHIVIFGQSYSCESCRSTKVIRCNQCQRFGHIAQVCLYPQRCVNCSENHNVLCTLPSKCANCGGEHGADSNRCPTYLGIKERLEHRKMASC